MKTERDYLEHIRDCIEMIQQYTASGRESLDDLKTQDAVIRRLQVMAESCLRLSDAIVNAYPEVVGSTFAISATGSSTNILKSILN